MNGGQIGFYATVATAIPVLLLGYVAGAITLARRGVESFGHKALKSPVEILLMFINDFKRDGTSFMGFFAAEILLVLYSFFFAFLVVTVVVVVIAVVVFLLLGAPALGEYYALHALATNRSSTTANMWAAIGLSSTAAAVLGPAAFVTVLSLGRVVKRIRHDWLTEQERQEAEADARLAALYDETRREHE